MWEAHAWQPHRADLKTQEDPGKITFTASNCVTLGVSFIILNLNVLICKMGMTAPTWQFCERMEWKLSSSISFDSPHLEIRIEARDYKLSWQFNAGSLEAL